MVRVTTSGVVHSFWITSTSGTRCGGFQKCVPTTRSRCLRKRAISVVGMAELLLARIVSVATSVDELDEDLLLEVELFRRRLEHELHALHGGRHVVVRRDAVEHGRHRRPAARGSHAAVSASWRSPRPAARRCGPRGRPPPAGRRCRGPSGRRRRRRLCVVSCASLSLAEAAAKVRPCRVEFLAMATPCPRDLARGHGARVTLPMRIRREARLCPPYSRRVTPPCSRRPHT